MTVMKGTLSVKYDRCGELVSSCTDIIFWGKSGEGT